MKVVENNDIVSIAFVGKLDDGNVFIQADENKPFNVTLGANELPPTVEKALVGLKIGENCKIKVSSDEGYGPRQKDLLQTIGNKAFIEKINPKPGMILSLKVTREGVDHQVPATVIEVKEDSVVVDYNHPLAGHNLTYEITVLDIQKSA